MRQFWCHWVAVSAALEMPERTISNKRSSPEISRQLINHNKQRRIAFLLWYDESKLIPCHSNRIIKLYGQTKNPSEE